MRMIRIGWIKYLILNLLTLLLFIVDRLVKIYFIKNPAVKFGGDFFYGLLSFHFEKNIGVAFGILVNQMFLSALVIFIILILVNFLIRAYFKKDSLETLALILIITGAISNLIDRLRFGYVVDYIDVPWFTVFNLADAMITFGVGILLINFWLGKRLDKKLKIL